MYQNSEKETYCRRWYGCPDSTIIRLNFVDEPGAIRCILRGAPQQIHIHTLTLSFY